MTSIHKDERAVSETIGFILIFAIVLTCIGIILLYGNQVLNVTKNENNFQSIQQGFIVLQSDLQQVSLGQAPVKTSTIHLEDGTVFFNQAKGHLTIKDNGTSTEYYNDNTGWITYSSSTDRSQVSIENGGLWMHYNDMSNYAVITTPRIYASQDIQDPPGVTMYTVVVNVIHMVGTDQAKSGPRTLSIQMKPTGTLVNTFTPTDNTIDLTYETNHPYAWQASLTNNAKLYGNDLDELSPVSSMPTSSSVKVTLTNVKTLIISIHDVGVALN
jgi:hypothetical protein